MRDDDSFTDFVGQCWPVLDAATVLGWLREPEFLSRVADGLLSDESMRLLKLDLLDEYRAGSAFWMWKQKPGFYNWQTVNPDGGLRDDSMRAQQLSRPHLDVVPGRLLSTSNEDGRLKAKIRSKVGNARIWSGTVVKSGG